jgi:hypothetical protein
MKNPTTWSERRQQYAVRYQSFLRPQRRSYLFAYSTRDFEQIAKAVGGSTAEILAHRHGLEANAFWFRAGQGFGMRRPKHLPPSKMQERMKRIQRAADRSLKGIDRLLKALEIRDVDDGIGEGALGEQIFEALTWHGYEDVEAAELELREFGKAREAAHSLMKRAAAAAADIEKNELKFYDVKRQIISRGEWSVPDGNQRDAALNDWVASSMSLYEKITGKCPKTSVRSAVDKRADEADGPLIRFLLAAGRPLGIKQSRKALRARIRRLQENRSN